MRCHTVLLMFFFYYLPAVQGLVLLLMSSGKKIEAGTLKGSSISRMTKQDELFDSVQVHVVLKQRSWCPSRKCLENSFTVSKEVRKNPVNCSSLSVIMEIFPHLVSLFCVNRSSQSSSSNMWRKTNRRTSSSLTCGRWSSTRGSASTGALTASSSSAWTQAEKERRLQQTDY